MKKMRIIKTICTMVSVLLIFTSCGTKVEKTVSEKGVPSETVSEFYSKYYDAAKRPIAVMIDNDNRLAWPHAGLSEAYLIYEINVEGSATRMMALFNETETKKIGPVRSSRHYFLDYALEHDAIYVHYGYSPQAASDIVTMGVNNINGVLGSDGGAFWREQKTANDYHDKYTSVEKIQAMISSKGYRTERQKTPLNFAKNDVVLASGNQANKVAYTYASFYRAGFEYDADKKAYNRYMNGSVHALQESENWQVKNILVLNIANYPYGDGSDRINLNDTGSGKGYYATLGEYIPITWEKSSRTAKTVFKDESGQEIMLNPGQTWIMVIPGNGTPVIE